MFCIYCGQKLDDNVRFCPYCGKPTGVGPKPVAEPKPVETAGSGIPLEEERTVEIPVEEESNPAARQEAGHGAAPPVMLSAMQRIHYTPHGEK